MSKVTKEHYVPCCYLWNFSFNKNNKSPQKSPIYVYDKIISKQFHRAVCDVASEYGFYDNENLGEKSHFLEDFLKHVEGDYSSLLKELIHRFSYDANHVITQKEKSELAAHFAIQYVRTLKHRNFLSYIVEKFKTIVPTNNVNYKRMESKHYVKDLHNEELISLESANNFANLFEHKKWAVIINKTSQKFCTSDNPICVINLFGSQGLCSPLCTIFVPISPNILIVMVDGKMPIYDCHAAEMTDLKMVNYYNKKQYDNCIRCVFSISDDFSFCKPD
ncbi:MAG: DUF4238 domain-containing protein [Ruminococcaceae bacterium]|nr:DUF4238 domain-containing protein [Oscillospiraceae bacterium]